MSKVILGHPYSGALYAYFADKMGGEHSHTRRVKDNSYYRNLYGANYENYVDVALTLLLLYDEVWMSPADTFWPGGNSPYIPELELHADWSDYTAITQGAGEDAINRYLMDNTIKDVLINRMRLPVEVWPSVMKSIMYESGLAVRKSCRLICTPGRKPIIDRLLEMEGSSLPTQLAATSHVEFVRSYNDVKGLALMPRSIDHLMAAKKDSSVRQYANSFLRVARSGARTKEDVARLIRDALERQAIFDLYGGVLTWAGTLFRIVVPKAGGVIGAGASALGLASKGARWHEFGGAINHAIDKDTLAIRLEQILAGEE